MKDGLSRKRPILIYATQEALDEAPVPLPGPLMDFIKAENEKSGEGPAPGDGKRGRGRSRGEDASSFRSRNRSASSDSNRAMNGDELDRDMDSRNGDLISIGVDSLGSRTATDDGVNSAAARSPDLIDAGIAGEWAGMAGPVPQQQLGPTKDFYDAWFNTMEEHRSDDLAMTSRMSIDDEPMEDRDGKVPEMQERGTSRLLIPHPQTGVSSPINLFQLAEGSNDGDGDRATEARAPGDK